MSLFFFIVEIPMSDERLYYIKEAIGDDKWLTYEQAHRYGCTHVKPSSITVYDANLQTVTFRVDPETNTFFDLRQDVPHDWLVSLDSLGLYRKLCNITLYRSEVPTTYESYTSIVSSSTPTHVFIQGEGLVSIRYLYEHRGITQHTCKNFMIDKGVLLVWYDSVEDLYWDNHSDVMAWVIEPPEIEVTENNYIIPFPNPIYEQKQWEYDLSQLPYTFTSYGTFVPAHQTVELITAFKNWDQWDLESAQRRWTRDSKDHWDIIPVPPIRLISFDETSQYLSEGMVSAFYDDIIKNGVPIYVIAEDGVYDAGGTLREFGYAFTGDYEYTWVDSDADVPLYQGTNKSIAGQSHDDTYEVLYYLSSKYYLPETIHNMGYTFTEGEDIEIWDSNLIGKRLWEDTQWLYLSQSCNDEMNIPVIDGTAKKASCTLRSNGYGNTYIEAKNAGEEGNKLSVNVSWLDSWSGRAGYQVTVYLDGVVVYQSQPRQTNIETDTINDYVVLSGSWPSVGFSGSSVTCYLSGGTDSTTIGVPIYYSDGTPVSTSDYNNYRVTDPLQTKIRIRGGSSADTYTLQNLVSNAEDFSFASDPGTDNLLLQYTGNAPINAILGFSFNWNNTGSIVNYNWIANPQYVFFTANGRNYPGIDVVQNTMYPLYYMNGEQVPYSDFDGLEIMYFDHQLYGSDSVIEADFGIQDYYRQFNNIGGFLYFMHGKSNTWSPMIGMSVKWQKSNNHYFYVQSNGSSVAYTNNDYLWTLQTRHYLTSLGLVEGRDFIEHWSNTYTCCLLPSMARRTSLVAAWTNNGENITSNLRVSTSRTVEIDGSRVPILTIDSTNATSELMGYILRVIPPTVNYIDVLLACKYDNSYADHFRLVTFSSEGTQWWAEVTNEYDMRALQSLGYFYPDTSYGLYGETVYSSSCTYRVLELYSDVGKTHVDVDPSKFYIANGDSGSSNVIGIFSSEALPSVSIKTYRLRIFFE